MAGPGSAVSLIAIFLGIVFWGGGSYALSDFAAAVPSVVLLRRWTLAGRRIDGWGCPKCAGRFPKNMTWS